MSAKNRGTWKRGEVVEGVRKGAWGERREEFKARGELASDGHAKKEGRRASCRKRKFPVMWAHPTELNHAACSGRVGAR